MNHFTIIDLDIQPNNLDPICQLRPLRDILVANTTLEFALFSLLHQYAVSGFFSLLLFPSESLLKTIIATEQNWIIYDPLTHKILAKCCENPPQNAIIIPLDSECIILHYPWNILQLHEQLMLKINQDHIEGKVWKNVTLVGTLHLGENSEILPGVMIEGTVVIGKNCRIGPNAYIRGSTTLGDGVKIGQAVEIKNSIIMQKTAVPHLSYVGDSIIGSCVNIAAGNIISNFRHDGANHKSMCNGELIDTQRRKFGAIIGDHVHTGINTTIYPGRKVWANMTTRPSDIIQKDLSD